jgi:uncharacterized OsmC-like protein
LEFIFIGFISITHLTCARALATFFYIIEKMRKDLTQNITSISVEVTGETTPPPDDYYNHIHVKYLIEGKSINRVTLERVLGAGLSIIFNVFFI